MKNLLKGYGDALNLFPDKPFPRVENPASFSSGEAIKKDWLAVAQDIRKSIEIVQKEIDQNGRRK